MTSISKEEWLRDTNFIIEYRQYKDGPIHMYKKTALKTFDEASNIREKLLSSGFIDCIIKTKESYFQ